jgi:hypothetical protein
MSRVIVTLTSNIERDEEGKPVLDDDGDAVLIDENIMGMLTKTHVIPFSTVNQEKNTVETGITQLSEVFWEHEHTPSPALVSPTDLYWISFPKAEVSVSEDEEDADEVGEQYEGNDEESEVNDSESGSEYF